MVKFLSHNIKLAMLLLAITCIARADLLESKTLAFLSPVSITDTIPDIKVKIFPHSNNFIPHKEDSIKSRVQITSSKPFFVYELNSVKESQESIISTSKRIVINAYKLKTPLLIKGQAPLKLHRSEVLSSYSYNGQLLVYPMKTSRNSRYLMVVNKINIEEYLRGVVPSEVIPTWNIEALKSQTVAARTYAIFHMLYARKIAKNPYFDVDDSITYQAYTGASNLHPSTDQAIKETRGEIITFNNKVIQAYYHADAGGSTDSAIDVWHKSIPYCISKQEPFKPQYHWKKQVSSYELTQKLRSKSIILQTQKVKDILIAKRTKNKRVLRLKLVLNDLTQQYISIGTLKSIINLDSSRFTITKSPDSNATFTFNGKGFGHGIGLSQFGAQKLGSVFKWNYQKILHHYYTSIHICSLHQKDQIEKCYINDISNFNDVDIDYSSFSSKKSSLEANTNLDKKAKGSI